MNGQMKSIDASIEKQLNRIEMKMDKILQLVDKKELSINIDQSTIVESPIPNAETKDLPIPGARIGKLAVDSAILESCNVHEKIKNLAVGDATIDH